MKHKSEYLELIFDGVYLLSAFAIGLSLLLLPPHGVRWIWGVMAILLASGDAFHLVPRMLASLSGNTERFRRAMGIGKQITSITMTLFYLILWQCGLQVFSRTLPVQTIVLHCLAGLRIFLCLLPQNKWPQGGMGGRIAIWRNLPFMLMGALVLWLYATFGVAIPAIRFVALAIVISFACYLPVVLWVDKYPKLGMLMVPKTCAYLWIVMIGYWV